MPLIIVPQTPTYGIGSPGDTVGMISEDDTNFYYTTGNYDGIRQIWYRIPKSSRIPIPYKPNQPTPPAPSTNLPTISISFGVSGQKYHRGSAPLNQTRKLTWTTKNATQLYIDGKLSTLSGDLYFKPTPNKITNHALLFYAVGPNGSATKNYNFRLLWEK